MGLCVSSNPNPPVFFPHVGEVVIFEQIAEGGYSVVFKAAGKSSSAYAVKRMICVEEEQLAMAKHEIEVYKMLQRVRNQHILELLDSYIAPSQTHPHATDVYLLFNYFPKTLHDYVNEMKSKGEIFTQAKLLHLFSQICEAVLQFHIQDPPLAVRDIKAANVLLTDEPISCILMDFGSVSPARQIVNDKKDAVSLQEEAEATISPSCRPVELFDVQIGLEIDERTDVWGLGTLLYFMAFQEFAFDATQGSVHLAALNGITSFPEIGDFDPQLNNLISKMCSPPEIRPTLPEVLKEIEALRLFEDR